MHYDTTCKHILHIFMLVLLLFTGFAHADLKITAHRGYSYVYPENATPAMRGAVEIGADSVEFDTRVTSDGYIVLMHDSSVDRTSDGTGSVSSMTLEELQQFDAGSWKGPQFAGTRIPTVTQALNEIYSSTTTIAMWERKTGDATGVVEVIQDMGLVDRIMVISFSSSFLADVNAIDSRIQLGWLGSSTISESVINTATSIGASFLSWSSGRITSSAVVDRVHDAGLELYAWTVNSPATMQILAGYGIDGIVTDRPDLVPTPTPTPTPTQTGTLTPTATATPIPQGEYALEFDGVDDYVQIPSTASLDIGGDKVTLEARVKLGYLPGTLPGSYGPIYDSAGDSYVFYEDKSANELRFKVTAGSAERPGISASDLSVGVWMHIAGVYDGTQAQIYLDGVLKDTHTGISGNIKTGQAAFLGFNPGAGQFFNGQIDEVRVWNVARNQPQIQSFMNQTLTGGEAGLVGYWNMNEGGGQTAHDSSGNVNDATLGVSLVSDTDDPAWVLLTEFSTPTPTATPTLSYTPTPTSTPTPSYTTTPTQTPVFTVYGWRDLLLLGSHWQETAFVGEPDLNGDNAIDQADLLELIRVWHELK
jgi:glycerophosphoryl diester phosphodiesterase